MRSRGDRDVVTLNIVTSLLIFTVVAALGTVPLILLDQLGGDGEFSGALGYVVLGCAAVVAFAYLWRHRRP